MELQHEAPPQTKVLECSDVPKEAQARDNSSQEVESTEINQSVETLGQFVSTQVQQYRRIQWITVLGLSGVMLLFVRFSMIAQHVYGRDRWLEWVVNPWFYSSMVTILLGSGSLLYAHAAVSKPGFRTAVRELAQQKDLRSVGRLVDALNLEDGRARKVVMDALGDLLPQLRASDASLLSASQQAQLRQILSSPVESPLFKNIEDLFRPATERSVRLRVAILKAFEQVGDSKALPLVERLANGEARTPAEKRIQAAAIECLPFLKARVAQETAPQTLLRPSQSTQFGSEVLVRPAIATTAANPQELLRASEQ